MRLNVTLTANTSPAHCTFGGIIVADVLDGLSHDLLVVHVSPGCDLPGQQDHARLRHRL